MNKKLIVGVIIAVVILCILCCVAGIALFPSAYEYLLENSSLQVGTLAPDFKLATISGETLELSQFRGQPVLLTIGATWCPDCKKEAALLQELHENHPEISIIMVDIKEGKSVVEEFVRANGLTYHITLDPDGRVSSQYKVVAIPTLLLINEEGVIKAKIIESVTQESLEKMLLDTGLVD